MTLLACALLSACASQSDLSTVPEVDIERYSGRWYEIARYPHGFQRQCAGNVTADYEPQQDGTIRVINRCTTRDGATDETTGTATVVPGSRNTKLKVNFGVPFITGDYWIIGLAPDYSWAIVGHPSRKYLWILAREPKISDELYERIISEVVAKGYDPSRLERTPQNVRIVPASDRL